MASPLSSPHLCPGEAVRVLDWLATRSGRSKTSTLARAVPRDGTSSVDREVTSQFFRVRLRDQYSVIGHLLAQYDKLGDDLGAELQLTRVWMLTPSHEDDE